MNKKYVFIDVDGTLFDQNTYSIPASAIDAITKAKDNGHHLIICTGRPYPSMKADFSYLPIDSFILCGGEHIVLNHKSVFVASFPINELSYLIDLLLNKEVGFVLEGCERNYITPSLVPLFKQIVNIDPTSDLENTIHLLKEKYIYPLSEFKEEDYKQVLKISIFTKKYDITKEIIDTVPSNLHSFIYPYTEHNGYYHGEIYVDGFNKAKGIDATLAYLNADLKDTIAIGDALNDLEMIQHCNIGIAMGNACQQLKEKADYITDSIDKDGFYNAFKAFGLL